MRRAILVALLSIGAAAGDAATSQEPEAAQAWRSAYELPDASVRELFERDKNFATLEALSPDGRTVLLPVYEELSTIARLGEPTQRLAGLELRGQRNRTWRLDTHGITGLTLFDLNSRTMHPIDLPADALVSDMIWSPGGRELAFLLHSGEQSEVWVADVSSHHAERLSDLPVMATLATRAQGRQPRPSRLLQWTPDGEIIALLVPADRAAPPRRGLPSGPLVRRTGEEARPNPTYPFLLEDATDEAAFRYYTTSQIARLKRGAPPQRLGEPGMFESIASSPDGAYLLTERIVEPLSPLVSAGSFARTLEIRDRGGAVVAALRQTPLREGRSRVPEGTDLPREVSWAPTASTLVFLQREQAAEGEAGTQDPVAPKDHALLLEAPFDVSGAVIVASSEDELSDVLLSPDSTRVFVRQALAGDRRSLVAFVVGADPTASIPLIPAWKADDPLVDPGEMMTVVSANGIRSARLSSDGNSVYLQGPGYAEDFRPRPFIDRVRIDGSGFHGSGTDAGIDRIFEGSGDRYERPLLAPAADLEQLVIQVEAVDTFPQSWLWSGTRGFVERLTANVDPFPEITAARRFDFDFTRRDGLVVRARISMPVGWQEGQRAPAVFWTYPREYDSAEDYRHAAVRARNVNEFTHLSYLRWSDIWLTQGYALVYPDVPIIGEPANDHYIQDLSDTLYAAIRKVDTTGWVDIDRIGHGGHSYGAFATANLLANTPYFKAGIAGDGAYNRTLTPMGFQSERRSLWEGLDIYLEMSPFFNADHLDTPLLMYHGGDDNNTGTFPVQSRRMMQALQGLGKTAVLYEYPYESHGPSAIESYLDLWKRWLDWFDRYVKGSERQE